MQHLLLLPVDLGSQMSGVVLLKYETIEFHCVRFEVFMAMTMKNAVFGDIKTQFVPHLRHITSLLQRTAS
jgi:hypothetical protein